MNTSTCRIRQPRTRSFAWGSMRALARLGALVAIAVLAPSAPSAAQIRDCVGIATESGLKILLDDIWEEAGGKKTTLPLMPSLRNRVFANLEQLRVESGLPLKVIRCEDRRPPDPSAFNQTRVQGLQLHSVILEVWGTTAEATDATGAPIQEATVGYLLVPVRFDEFTQGQPSGAFTLSRQAKSKTSLDDLVRLVDQSGELAAYVALSAGVRLLRTKAYDQARAQLCRAEGLLTRVMGAAPSANDEALVAYVRELASDVVTQAKANPAYAGVLKALPINQGGCR
jgi:hypothetical protein